MRTTPTNSSRPLAVRRLATCLAALTMLAILISCASSRFHSGGVLSARDTARVSVEGNVPFVQIVNHGPGPIDVVWPDAAAGGGGTEQLITGSIGRTIRGRGVVTLRAGNEGARFEIDVQRADGFNLLISPIDGAR